MMQDFKYKAVDHIITLELECTLKACSYQDGKDQPQPPHVQRIAALHFRICDERQLFFPFNDN